LLASIIAYYIIKSSGSKRGIGAGGGGTNPAGGGGGIPPAIGSPPGGGGGGRNGNAKASIRALALISSGLIFSSSFFSSARIAILLRSSVFLIATMSLTAVYGLYAPFTGRINSLSYSFSKSSAFFIIS
jgi:hypothetical protein